MATSGRAHTTIVMISRDRRTQLLQTLDRLRDVDPHVPVVLVDNGSRDGTAEAVTRRHPAVDVVRLRHNLGAAGRTVGVQRARSQYVAFADDDSWWAPGALDEAADRFRCQPQLGLLGARLRVEPDGRTDPVCSLMADSPLGVVPGVGPRVLGFVACAAVVRRPAYLQVGGFHPRFGVGGEEQLLAIDLAEAGWDVAYCEHVQAHHQPGHGRPRPGRARNVVRNALWTDWLRRPAPRALASVRSAATRRWGGRAGGRFEPTAGQAGLVAAACGLPWVLRQRRPVGPHVERQLRLLDAEGIQPAGRGTSRACT